MVQVKIRTFLIVFSIQTVSAFSDSRLRQTKNFFPYSLLLTYCLWYSIQLFIQVGHANEQGGGGGNLSATAFLMFI